MVICKLTSKALHRPKTEINSHPKQLKLVSDTP